VIGSIDQDWRRLEVRHLVALETTARLGSFRAAAHALGYSQSAVSGQIAALEAIVGTRLLDRPRGSSGVTPTPAGRLLLDRAERVADILAAARADLGALAAAHDVLRIGIFQSASGRLLAPVVRALRAARPDLELRLHEAIDPNELIDLALRGDLDIVFANGGLLDDALESVLLLDDPYVLVVARDHPLATARSVEPSTVAELPLITYRSLPAELLPTALLPRARPLEIIFRSDDDTTVRALVAAGVGAALVPQLSVEPGDLRVRAIPIAPSLPARRISLAWLRSRAASPALQAFVEATIAAAAEHSEGREPRLRHDGP